MHPGLDLLRARQLLLSWGAAALGLALVPMWAVLGQAVGALAGGCQWIGVSLAVDRTPWALVNQPTLAFAGQTASLGYWWGSSLAPLLVALAVVLFLPRRRGLTAELLALQTGWASSCIGLGWYVFAEPSQGHLARWLELRRLPDGLVWILVVAGTVCGLGLGLRLLALLAGARRDPGRLARVAAVVLHLAVPVGLWLGVLGLVRPPEILAMSATVAPLLPVLIIAIWGAPAPYVFDLEGPGTRAWLLVAAAGMMLWGTLWITGRPLPEHRVAGVLWAEPLPTNNIRPWIDRWRPRPPWAIGAETGRDGAGDRF